MICKFIDVKSAKNCDVITDSAYCDLHSQTLQARQMRSQILLEDGYEYVMRDGMVCAYMEACVNMPLTFSQLVALREKNIKVHPYVEYKLTSIK